MPPEGVPSFHEASLNERKWIELGDVLVLRLVVILRRGAATCIVQLPIFDYLVAVEVQQYLVALEIVEVDAGDFRSILLSFFACKPLEAIQYESIAHAHLPGLPLASCSWRLRSGFPGAARRVLIPRLFLSPASSPGLSWLLHL